MANEIVAIENIEAIALRARELRCVPQRDDPSGLGKKLHNLRMGRLAPRLREQALAVVRRILGDDEECSGAGCALLSQAPSLTSASTISL